jgi:hypothetical protein
MERSGPRHRFRDPYRAGRHLSLRALWVGLAAASYAAVLLALVPGHQAAADSHYHFSVAREIARGTFVPDVARGLPFTVLRDMPVDHYWGYHVLLAPFARLANPELGMKLATVTLFALVCVATYLFLRARKVSYAWAWAIAPMLFSTQDWRFLQLRGGQLMLPLLLAMAQVAFFGPRARLRRIALVGLGYVAMLSYHGGLVLLVFHLGGVAALLALKRTELAGGRLWEPGLTALGLALGLTLNPYMDRRASTWRFAALHVGDMGRDSAHLYDDQPIAEFHGFPASVLLSHPEWLVLLLAVLVALGVVVGRSWREPEGAPRDCVVLAGLAIAGIALTAQAMRAREYSVPVTFCFLAVLAPRSLESRAASILAAGWLALGLWVHGRSTLPLIAGHLPTHQYRGARTLLEDNGSRPILNIAEADYCMLRWEYDRVVCVQALSRYFIYPYRDLFHDVWELHDHADTSPETASILRRFWDRGVRLVAVHRTHKMMRYAETHPLALKLVFRSEINGASIFALDPDGLSP